MTWAGWRSSFGRVAWFSQARARSTGGWVAVVESPVKTVGHFDEQNDGF